jgi:transcriptional regulator with PAS, ATPase and Fis domain
MKTDVRVIAATNVNLMHAVSKGKFREDLYYRLNAVSIFMPALRERKTDINILFRKFASDFATKYGMRKVTLTEDASIMLRKYRWPGNIRQLKNVAESISALESGRMSGYDDKCEIDTEVLSKYIPKEEPNLLPAVSSSNQDSFESPGEREAVLRMLLQLKQDVDYLKKVVANAGLAAQPPQVPVLAGPDMNDVPDLGDWQPMMSEPEQEDPEEQVIEEGETNLSLEASNLDLIAKVLKKHGGNRKEAAEELGISERTLYRKLKMIKQ